MVIDVATACSNVSSICQIGIVGFRAGVEVFAFATMDDPCDRFSAFNTRIHGITSDHVVGKPTYAYVHDAVSAHLGPHHRRGLLFRQRRPGGRLPRAPPLADRGDVAG